MVITTRKCKLDHALGLGRRLVPLLALLSGSAVYAGQYCTTWSFHGGGMSNSGKQCFPDEASCKAAVIQAKTTNGAAESFGRCLPDAGTNAGTVGSGTGDPNAMVTQGLGNAMAGAMTNDPTRFGSGLGQVGAGLILQSLFDSPSPEEQARAAQLAEAQRQEAERRAAAEREAEALRIEQQKQRLLGAMKGLDSDNAAQSSSANSGATLAGGQTNFFGLGASTGLKLKTTDSEINGNQIAAAAPSIPSPTNGISMGTADKQASANPTTASAVMIGGMKLKGLDSDNPTVPPGPPSTDSTPVISLGQTVAVIPRDGDPEHLARGTRVVDCKATRQFYDRMAKGLPMQREWLERLQEQLADARADRREQIEETRKMIKEDTIDTLKDLMWQSDVLRAELNGLNAAGMPLAKRKALAHALKMVNDIYDGADLGKKTVEAGEPYIEALTGLKPETYGDYTTGRLVEKKTSLSDKTEALFQFLDSSGLLEEEGKDLSEKLGPQALMLFSIAKLNIDVWSNVYDAHITDSQLQQAKQNESVLREQIGSADARLKEAQDDLNQYCKTP